MQQFKLSESTAARRRVYIHCVDATDGITPETGEAAGQPQVSKNGASFGNTSATLTAIGNGAYYVELTTGELDTLGYILVRYKSANTAEAQVLCQVVAYDPYDSAGLGLTRLDAAVTTRSTITTAEVNTEVDNALNTAIPGSPTADSINERLKTIDDAYTAARGAKLDYLDASVAARATPADVNAQVLDVLATDTFAEPSQAAPPATTTLQKKLDYLYMMARNKEIVTATERRFYADDESTILCKGSVGESGGTFTRGELATGA